MSVKKNKKDNDARLAACMSVFDNTLEDQLLNGIIMENQIFDTEAEQIEIRNKPPPVVSVKSSGNRIKTTNMLMICVGFFLLIWDAWSQIPNSQ